MRASFHARHPIHFKMACISLPGAFYPAMSLRGGSAEMVQELLELQADVNFQFDLRRDLSAFGRLFYASKSLKHRLGFRSLTTMLFYHTQGMTPLMAAVWSGQHAAAAALIAHGARLELRNGRGWSAKDFAQGQAVPEWLLQGLEDHREECQRVNMLALPQGEVQISF